MNPIFFLEEKESFFSMKRNPSLKQCTSKFFQQLNSGPVSFFYAFSSLQEAQLNSKRNLLWAAQCINKIQIKNLEQHSGKGKENVQNSATQLHIFCAALLGSATSIFLNCVSCEHKKRKSLLIEKKRKRPSLPGKLGCVTISGSSWPHNWCFIICTEQEH